MRTWVIITLAVVGAATFVTVSRVREALSDRWLIEHGVPVNAKVLMGDGLPTPKRLPRHQALTARLRIELPDQAPMEIDVIVAARQGGFLQVGGELPIKVDPANPRRWTEETVPRPWSAELVVPAMSVPLIAAVVFILLLKRRSVLQTWSKGDMQEAVVVGARQIAIAPSSRAIRYSLADGSDPRIFSLLLPTSAGVPEQGSKLWILARPSHPASAIAAGLYVDR